VPLTATRLRAAEQGIPPFVWWATLALLGLLLLYGLLVPVYQAPDEPEHVDAVLLAVQARAWPLGVEMHGGVVASREVAGFAALPLVVDQAPDRADRPSFADLGDGRRSGEINQMTQHPPLYYALLGGALGTLGPSPSDTPYDTVVGVLRLWNMVLVLPLPLLAYLASRRVTARREAQVAATLFPLAIPQFVHIGSSVNNDNLLVLLCASLTVLLLVAVDEPERLAVAVGAGVVAGAALLTKGFALVTPIWIVLAYGLAWKSDRRAAWRGAVALVTALTIGGWWWVRNVAVHGVLQPYGVPLPDYRGEDFVPLLSDWLPHFASRIALRFWGSIGWFSVHLPWWLVWVATAVVVVAACVVVVASARRGRPRRHHLTMLAFPVAALLLGVAATSWDRYAARASLGGIHGRYLFGGLVCLAVVVGFGLALLLRRRLAVPAAVAVLGLTLHAMAVRRMLDHYWDAGASPGVGGQVPSMLAWSPWPPVVAAFACVLLVAAAAGLAAGAYRACVCGEPQDERARAGNR
jgi:small subunit ribosomal protein S36